MTLLPPARRLPAAATAFARDLERHGDRPALVVGEGGDAVTYADLARRADGVAARLGSGRRLVVVEAANTVDAVVAELACLRAGHPLLLVPGGPHLRGLVDVYDPDVVIRGGDVVDRHGGAAAHDLHPDLALLLSTSGSTGAPKLVRLSTENLRANAESIAGYLGLGPDDRAMTSLPIGYCYGLSVLHSHLARGASVVLSDRSVVDEAFWRTFRRHGATSFAGVPHTFDLLDRIGFADLRLPSLRYVTQAGGRLAPATVRRYAELGRRRGWELFVMYGQTEATARIAYLPPALVSEHPGAIGIPVPGGHLRLADVDGDGIGELVYRGPNVMLGYAHGPSDLALGRTVDELRTGDLARHDAQGGVFEVVGRRHRFVKPFGLRVDLDRVEEHLRAAGVVAACAGDDHRLVVATSPDDAIAAAALVRDHVGLPAGAVHAHGVDALPRLPNGKLDHGAVLALGAAPVRPARATGVRRLFADALQVPVVGDDATFASLGGDSLSYVELSVRLEEALGDLPDDWPTRTVADLERRREAAPAAGRTVAVETTVVLRAAAIVLVVATHATLVDVKGGAHLLLAVAGWNFARFQLPVGGRRLAGSIGRIALPTMAWVAGLLVVSDDYGLANLALVHTQVHEAVWDPRWRFWFVEALVQILVVCGVVVGVPPLRRLERRAPFGFAVALLGASLALRVLTDVGDAVRRPQAVAWFFFLGWAMHRSRTPGQKLALSAVAVAAVPRFFGQPLRELVIIAGLLALLWVRGVPLVRPLPRVAGAVASASLVVYLTHWQVYPPLLEVASPAVAVAASLGVGLALHAAFQRVLPRLRL